MQAVFSCLYFLIYLWFALQGHRKFVFNIAKLIKK